ncbi:MAG: sigma-70 family RNA polymerase sigma factor [Brevinematales bacterium]|nr:sigma-70 family RNA polymerase sigma factor [Brevinematales bacterium]
MKKFYEILTEEELFSLIKYDKIAEKEFYSRYKRKVKNIVKNYQINSLEREDLIQEGMIGLFKAIETFDEKMKVKFSTYAKKCIENQIKNALNVLWKHKKAELSSEEKLDELIEINDPEIKTIEDEAERNIQRYIENFETIERLVIEKFIDGKKYKEIAEELNISVKKVDNILSKVRKKLAEYIRNKK